MAANSPVKHMFPHPHLERVISISPASIVIFTCLNLKAMRGKMECDGWPELTREWVRCSEGTWAPWGGVESSDEEKVLWRAETLSRQPPKSMLVAIIIVIDFWALSPWHLSISLKLITKAKTKRALIWGKCILSSKGKSIYIKLSLI